MNTDFSYCKGANSELCKKCKRLVENNPVIFTKYAWFVEQEYNTTTKKCKNYIQK